MRQRVAVLIDYENVRNMAQLVFGRGKTPSWFGHVDPLRLATVLTGERTLADAFVFRGEPDRTNSPGPWEDFRRRREAWSGAGVHVKTAPVRHGSEKGMDVALTAQLVYGAARDEYDVAIIVSGDNDFLTAIPTVRALGRQVEVAGWRSSGCHVPGTMMRAPDGVRCRVLDQAAFLFSADDPAKARRHIADREQPTAMRLALIKAGIVHPDAIPKAAA
jgi:uncharacterized LabA/DUF88 family protein